MTNEKFNEARMIKTRIELSRLKENVFGTNLKSCEVGKDENLYLL